MRKIAVFLFLTVLFLSACNDSPSPSEWEHAPGMPNWYSKEYDWIDSAYEKCANANFFEPKFILRVGGVSPDGRTVLGVHRYQELFLFDVNTRQVTERIGKEIRNFHDARWSNNGKLILGSHLQPDFGKLFVSFLFDMNMKSGEMLSLPDSVEPLGSYMVFMNNDASILLHRYPKQEGDIPLYFVYSLVSRKITYTPQFDAVGNIAVVSDRENIWFRRNYISPDFSESVDLRVASVDKPDNVSTYRLPDVLRVGRAQLSRDGNWLSALMEMRLPDDRFLSASTLAGLGIIDLRPGSPYRYKIYAFYPDHSNAFKVCVNGFSLPGSAWSPDNKYVYHEQIRLSDTTVQFVRREVATGKVEVISNFKGAP